MQGAISIKISKDQTVPGQAPDIGQQREPGKPSTKDQAINTVLISAGRQILTQGISQFAELSGNYAAADRIDTVLSIASDVAIIAAGGTVGAIAVGVKYGMNIINSAIGQTVAMRDIELLRTRAGFISTQGSRYAR